MVKQSKKEGDSLRVTGNMKFYIVGKKITGVNLRKYDGTVWKIVDTSSGSATFPAVNLNSANMCLGWSRTKGKQPILNIRQAIKFLPEQETIIWLYFSQNRIVHRHQL